MARRKSTPLRTALSRMFPAAVLRRVAAATEARWATQLGSKKMKSLRALLEELAATVEQHPSTRTNGVRHKRG